MADVTPRPRVVVVWIDWYAYHVARFRGLLNTPEFFRSVAGIELVGGIGVHEGLKFREELPSDLPVTTLMHDASWCNASKFKLARLVWTKLSQLDPEMVLVPGYYTLPGLATAVWARVHGAVSILMTESTAYDHERVGWKETLKKFGFRVLFDWAVAGGKAHIDYLHQLGFRPEQIVDCYDVVDNEFFRLGTDALRVDSSKLAAPYDNPSFLYVGRMASEKNVSTLLDAWIAYRKDGGSWPLVLVGDGAETASLRQRVTASSYGADVYFPGLKSSAELLPYYAAAGCFVLPSTREPWGLVVNEAMAAGLPVLVSDRCGCARDLVVDGENGFIFNPHDVDRLILLLHKMEQFSSEQREQFGRAASARIQAFSPEAFGASIARIYASAMGRPQTALSGTSGLTPAGGGVR